MQNQSTQRAFQLSYLRAFVTLLVVAHHAVLAYVSIKPPRLSFNSSLLWTAFPVTDAGQWRGFDLLIGWNDVFFMALMFFVSGLFVWPGLRRYGARKFIGRRFWRLGVPFVVSAVLLAPLAYYPAYLVQGGDAHLGRYASAWLALAKWPAGPAWFLWVLLVFDCIAAAVYKVLPGAIETLARGVRALSSRPVLLFVVLVSLSGAAYVPMALHFGGLSWWSWGPFFVQSSRAIHYFVYFVIGICLGAFGTENPIFERTGRLAQRIWLWRLGMVVAFLALAALTVTGRSTAATVMFPVSCAASSLFVMAAVIRFARPRRWSDSLSENAYGIYLVHYVFVVWTQYALLHWAAPALVKGLAVVVVATALSWTTSSLLRQGRSVAKTWFDGLNHRRPHYASASAGSQEIAYKVKL